MCVCVCVLVAYVSCYAWLLGEGVVVVVCFGLAVKTNVIPILNIWFEFSCKNLSTIYISILPDFTLFYILHSLLKEVPTNPQIFKSEPQWESRVWSENKPGTAQPKQNKGNAVQMRVTSHVVI